MFRVDWGYTQHIIKSGNAFMKHQQKNKQISSEVPLSYDYSATSSVGLIGHLNTKLNDMTKKEKGKQKSAL